MLAKASYVSRATARVASDTLKNLEIPSDTTDIFLGGLKLLKFLWVGNWLSMLWFIEVINKPIIYKIFKEFTKKYGRLTGS